MRHKSLTDLVIDFFLDHKLVAGLLLLFVIAAGTYHAPFNWEFGSIDRDPVAVDALPNLGENQQIVYVEWMGHNPREIEDQITFPLSTSLLGVNGVRTVRGSSMNGMSSVYVVFEEDVDFATARSRILEKIASYPESAFPAGVKPTLGPDATPLGQVFWYTLEGRDADGKKSPVWSMEERRRAQDWLVKPVLESVSGVAETASAGGGALEYLVELDPDRMTAAKVNLHHVFQAIEFGGSNADARTFELNGVEYYIRGIGAFRRVEDVMDAVVTSTRDGVVRISDVAKVKMTGDDPTGMLDRNGEPAVGGVIVARQGTNPMQVIKAVREKIVELTPGMPEKTLPDGSVSRLTIVPFYDRSVLIGETLDTLSSAIKQQILITMMVILFMLSSLKTGIMVSGLMPAAVFLCFFFMRRFGIDANLVSLSGIAIAVGTISDMGIVLCENIARRLRLAPPGQSRLETVRSASHEVGSAVMTAVLTTIVGFLPVFAMTGPEGRMFKPLAYTKTFCLLAAIVLSLTLLPPLAHMWLGRKDSGRRWAKGGFLLALAGLLWFYGLPWPAGVAAVFGLWQFFAPELPAWLGSLPARAASIAVALAIGAILAMDWAPLGVGSHWRDNLFFIWAITIGMFVILECFIFAYPTLLRLFLRHKALFLCLPVLLCLAGLSAWLGFGRTFGFIPKAADMMGYDAAPILSSRVWTWGTSNFPGLGKEFMPSFDEGAFLSMPTLMPHGSAREAQALMNAQDLAFLTVPEVEEAVGKIGRVESALDPAPMSMLETIITVKNEYLHDPDGSIPTFAFDSDKADVFRDIDGKPILDEGAEIPTTGTFLRDNAGKLVPDPFGRAFRQWRPKLKNSGDLWREIEIAGRIPGLTGAPRLYPIEARVVMLQTGIRAPMGVKIKGPSIKSIDNAAVEIEKYLRLAPKINPGAVAADRALGRPYMVIIPDRYEIGRRGITMEKFQHFVETAIGGGMPAGWAYEGRARLPVRLRYAPEFRSDLENIKAARVPAGHEGETTLGDLADFHFIPGPEMIGTEDSFPVGHVVFDRLPEVAEVDAVNAARDFLAEKRDSGEMKLPEGVTYSFTGSYENQVRSEKRMALIIPISFLLIFLIIYKQFKSVTVSFILFSGVPLAFAGGMIFLWLYGQDWFLAVSPFGLDLRELMNVRPYNLSVAVWVGFLALFGVATDDGIVMTTYLENLVRDKNPQDVASLHDIVVEAGLNRVRPCLMTTATTVLALLPVLTSLGRGSEIMAPMALPSFGGMTLEVISMFVVPVCYSILMERRIRKHLTAIATANEASN